PEGATTNEAGESRTPARISSGLTKTAFGGVTLPIVDQDCLDDWFIREILVHEEVLMSYLFRRWPIRSEVPDLRQEVYVRVYEAAAKARPAAPRAFLFTT